MADQPVFLTQEGYNKLKEELEHLRTVRRQEVAQRLRAAVEGVQDVMENAEYEDAKNEQAFVEGRILTLETMLRNAVIIEEGSSAGTVGLGSRVTVVEGDSEEPETYHIVGSAEADPQKGRVSNESPLGRALLGHRVGDEVIVNAPDGILRFRIIAIQ
ncbi:MAG TPA: transcription elongation factor GreA [Anaerolineae bacterium]|nr:transcription elongation factor GreA [Anaerolineae bacterium]